jgi:hypothetical protein
MAIAASLSRFLRNWTVAAAGCDMIRARAPLITVTAAVPIAMEKALLNLDCMFDCSFAA